MKDKPRIAGVGMVPFTKAGRSPPYDAMAADAARQALADAGIAYGAVQQAYVGFVIGDTTSGQQALYPLGLTGIPIVNVPGCPVQPDNFMETLLYLLYQAAGMAPMIPLDNNLRPTWLFGKTVHEGCDRAGYYEQGDFAAEYGSPKCLVKLGCWGPVVNCNVTKRGWMDGIGGCPNVGGICIACTMPGFPDKFMPFMDEPPGSKVSAAASGAYGGMIRALRSITNHTVNQEPKWRHKGPQLTTGYRPRW